MLTIRAYFALARTARFLPVDAPVRNLSIRWPWGQTGAIFFA